MPLRRILILAAAFTPLATSARQPASKPLTFEVATVKPAARPNGGWNLHDTPDGYTGLNVSLFKLTQEAYGISDAKLISGGPPWIDTDKFDLEAKFDPPSVPDAKNLTYRQRADMLQPLLAERFHLKVHFETKDFSVYNLVIAKVGPKFQPTKPENIHQGDMGPRCLIQKQGPGITQRRGCSVDSLDDLLRYNTGRTVIDKTGLTGIYDLELHWTPENTPAESPIANGPSIFTALQEQLGLKLEPSTAPLKILVIDHVDKPSEN